jgi:hypothetical protein
MVQTPENNAFVAQLAEFKRLFGPPPVLSTESVEAYHDMMASFTEALRPRDLLEYTFVKELTDATWDLIRYTRHKALAMDRKFRARLEHQAKRAKLAKERKEALTKELADQVHKAATLADRKLQLEIDLMDSAGDICEILARPPEELDHAQALEDAIEYHERLDTLLNTAISRRNNVLEQLQQYRDGLCSYEQHLFEELFLHNRPDPPSLAPPRKTNP